MESLVILQEQRVKEIVKSAILELEQEKEVSKTDATYTIAAVAKRLKMAHATIKKLVVEGYLDITTNGRIPERSIREFLKKR